MGADIALSAGATVAAMHTQVVASDLVVINFKPPAEDRIFPQPLVAAQISLSALSRMIVVVN